MKKLTINKKDKTESLNFKELAKTLFIDVRKKIERPPIAISKGEYSQATSFYPTPICTYSNFSAISGPSKSMKTFFKTALVAGYIGGKSNYYFEDIKGHDTEGKFVVDLDTEQSEYHVSLSAKRVVKMIGGEYNYYLPFQLRALTPMERFQFIEWIFMESEWKDNLGFVAVDGIADIISNTNDLEQSSNATNAFMKWSAISKAHITTVIHNNFDSNKPTGHIGSSITKKAETVMKVKRDEEKNIVTVSPSYTRNIPFDEFEFTLNNDFLPKQTKYGRY